MAVVREKKSELERVKLNISQSHDYFKDNYKRFHTFRKYAFKTAIDENQETLLADQGKPIIEFNILMAYINRLLGEFAKHEPSIEVRPGTGIPVDPMVIELVEGHIRHINYEANKNSCSYEIYKDILSGGFSVLKVLPEWESSMSFLKSIKKVRVFDPTLCGFDPMARHSHKGDGRFCYEIYPKTYEDFEREYPDVDISKVSFCRDIEGFNWSYLNNQKTEVLLMAEYFEKKTKKAKIVKLANGRVMTTKNYEKFEAFWQEQQFVEQIPKPVGKSRMTEIDTIVRKLLIESEIFREEETDFTYLPLVFVDGNSVILQEGTSNNTYQFTRPYIYDAKGIQDLKNFAGQCLGNYLNTIVQHKFIVMKEALPQQQDYQDAIKDIQHANTIVVNAFVANNPEQPIATPIREVQTVPAPPEVMGTFTSTDQLSQMILGTFDAALGINDNQLSGVAVIESATQSNASAFPYIVGYLQAETQCANIIADLIPKYMQMPQQIPVVTNEGKRSFEAINGKNPDGTNQPKMDYDEKALNVEISAGVNYAIAKNKALTQIFAMMQSSPTAAEFFSTEGFPQILDNMEFYHSDVVKEKAEKWLEQKKSQPPQPNPEQVKAQSEMAKLQQKNMELQTKQQMHQSQLQIDILKLQQAQQKVMADIKLSEDQNYRENKRAAVEHASKLNDGHMARKDMEHRHSLERDKHEHTKREHDHDSIRESVKLHHEINQPTEENTMTGEQ